MNLPSTTYNRNLVINMRIPLLFFLPLFTLTAVGGLWADTEAPSQLTLSLPDGGKVISSDELEPKKTEESLEPSEGFLMNFNNLNIIEVLRFISRISGKNFVFNEDELNFNVTIISEETTSIDNIMAALLQILKINGLSLIEQGNNILIHSNQTIKRPSKLIGEKVKDSQAEKAELATRVFRLASLPADKVATIVKPMLSDDSLVEVVSETNHLVITDIKSNIGELEALILSLDAPESVLEIGQYVAANVHIGSLVNLAEQIIAPLKGESSIELILHDTTSSVYIVSTPQLVERAISILQALDHATGTTRVLSIGDLSFDQEEYDQAILEKEELGLQDKERQKNLPKGHIDLTKFEIYKLQNRTAITIQDALSQISDSLGDFGQVNEDLIAAIDSVQAITESNSLVISGTSDAIQRTKELIHDLDIPLRQVFIEMLILETNIQKSLQFGVEWGSRLEGGTNESAQIGFLKPESLIHDGLDAFANPSLTSTANLATQLGVTSGFSAGVLGKILKINDTEFVSLGAVINALEDDGETNIIMNPKILTEDNSPAEIFVGLNTPFRTESITTESGAITDNFEFRDIGTSLRVTPFLGDGNVVTLEIEQNLTRAETIQGTSAFNPGPTTSTTRTTTRVHVPDQYFLVLSGMTQESRTRSESGIPCLGGVPGAGAAFSRTAFTNGKSNLMIFIRPQIIDTYEQMREVTTKQRSKFMERSKPYDHKAWEMGAKLDILKIKRSKKTP